MIINKMFKLVACSLLSLTVIGCNKLLDAGNPSNQITNEQIFSNDSLAQAIVINIYTQMMRSKRTIFNGGISLFAGLSGDELVTENISYEQEFYNNNIEARNPILDDSLWAPAYRYIYPCNLMIQGLSNPNKISPQLKKRLLGESSFMRALCYYYLVNLFGDVPLVSGIDWKTDAIAPRSSEDKIYQQIVSDLATGELLLTNDQPKTFVSKLACQALLSRVYLHQKEWAKAEDYATLVINSGICNLEDDLDKVFLSESKESIFQLQPLVSSLNTMEGNMFIPLSNSWKPNLYLDSNLEKSFEAGDVRKTHWLKTISVNGSNYSFPYKYKVRSGTTITEYNIVLRLAEEYLIRAEARAQRNNLSDAIADIDMIRKRAGVSLIADMNPGIDQNALIDAIFHERRVELFTEWGHRWIDLKRTNQVSPVLSAAKGWYWENTDTLYPIPAIELSANPFLVQNAGY